MSCKMGNFMNLRVFALLGVLLLAGCSGLSVRHLPSNPWKNEASQNIQMRYLAFQYQVIPVGNELESLRKPIRSSTSCPTGPRGTARSC